MVFTDYSPLSGNAEIVRRRLSPLAAVQVAERLARAGQVLSDQPVDLRTERFLLYAPAQAPASGYGVMVFVPPWPEAVLPPGWGPVLDRSGVIFVSAARSGNDASGLGRREPLAVLAARNVMRRYPVDPDRVYVAGLSGGSRIAMRLALAYPDLFRGAILNAGSDAIGAAGVPAPPQDLLLRLQSTSRLVYVTGNQDVAALAADADSLRSMRDWCVFNVDVQTVPGMGHDLPPPAALARALQALATPVRPDAGRLAACRASLAGAVSAKLDRVDALIAGGRRDAAQRLLTEIDGRYGGAAAPRSTDLEQKIAASPRP